MSSNNDKLSKRGKNLISNTTLLGIGTFLTKGIGLIMVVFYSRWLSTSNFGDYDLLTTYLALFIPVATLSCGEAVFRFLLEKNELHEKREIITTAVIISVCGFFVFVVLLTFFARKLFQDYFSEYLILFALETVFELCQHCSRGLHKLKYYTLGSIINSIVVAISATILICVYHMQIRGLIIAHIIGYGISAVFIIFSLRLYKFVRISNASCEEAKEIIRYSAPLMPNSIAWWIANSSDRSLIRIYLGSEFNGIYAIANKVPSLCITLFNVFHLSWQESASDAVKEDNDPTGYFNRVFTKLIPTVLSIAIGVLAINFILFKYVFDIKYEAAYVHVAILTSATVLSFLGQFIGGIFIGLKKTTVNGATTLFAAIINIIVDFAFIRSIGLFAASVSTLVAYMFLFVSRYIIVRRTYELAPNLKCYIYIGIYGFFIISQYINNNILHYFNLLFAIVLFLYTNQQLVLMLARKVGLKKRKQ